MNDIKGIIPAIVSPMNNDYSVNTLSLKELVNYLYKTGIHGIFANGSQGEFYALTCKEKQQVLETVVNEVNGQIPVYAGTGAITTKETIKLSKMAEEIGASAVSIITPYFIKPSQEELYEHYLTVAKSVRIPVLIYNNPSKTGVAISSSLVERLCKIDNIVGIKDSSGDLTFMAELIRATRNLSASFSVLAGNDAQIYAALSYGGVGAISATANIASKLYVELYNAFLNGNHEMAKELQLQLTPLRIAFSMGTFPVVIKEALNLMGYNAGPARLPAKRLEGIQLDNLKSLLKSCKII